MSQSLNVAIFGTGRVAKVRLREVESHPGWQPVAIVSSSTERATDLAPDLPNFSSAEDLLSQVDLDAVMVCSANSEHFSQAKACLLADKHVSVDYPLALDFDQGQSLVRLAQQRQRILHVEHIDLLSPWYVALREALPRVGEILALQWTDWNSRQRKKERDWVFDTQSGFSLIMHAAIFSRILGLTSATLPSIACTEALTMATNTLFDRRVTSAHGLLSNGVPLHILDAVGVEVQGLSSAITVLGSKGIIAAAAKSAPVLTTADGQSVLDVTEGAGLFAQDIDCFYQQIVNPDFVPYVSLQHSLQVLKAGQMAFDASKRDPHDQI
jgi:biliverdin reductase